MSIVRDFVTKLPQACGAKSPAWGKMNQLAFDHEVAHPVSEFSHAEGQSVEERLAPGFGFTVDPLVDQMAANYGRRLLELAAVAYAASKGEVPSELVSSLRSKLASREADFPNVSALMTVEQASTLGSWA
jgi:hypothetical protein